MKKRIAALLLIAALFITFTGCSDVVGDIAGNVADAALKELEKQIKSTIAEYKVDIVDVKSAVGRLNNDSDSDLQFFCGVLVRSNSDALPNGAAGAVEGLFERCGIEKQTTGKIENENLTNKTISFKHLCGRNHCGVFNGAYNNVFATCFISTRYTFKRPVIAFRSA